MDKHTKLHEYTINKLTYKENPQAKNPQIEMNTTDISNKAYPQIQQPIQLTESHITKLLSHIHARITPKLQNQSYVIGVHNNLAKVNDHPNSFTYQPHFLAQPNQNQTQPNILTATKHQIYINNKDKQHHITKDNALTSDKFLNTYLKRKQTSLTELMYFHNGIHAINLSNRGNAVIYQYFMDENIPIGDKQKMFFQLEELNAIKATGTATTLDNPKPQKPKHDTSNDINPLIDSSDDIAKKNKAKYHHINNTATWLDALIAVADSNALTDDNITLPANTSPSQAPDINQDNNANHLKSTHLNSIKPTAKAPTSNKTKPIKSNRHKSKHSHSDLTI